MKKLNLQSIIRKKRKYSSYKGQVGKIADNQSKEILKPQLQIKNGLQM